MIGIVILNYENWADTERCIKSILAYPPEEDFYIYCVDNASKNKPNQWLIEAQHLKRMTIIYNQTNIGYAAGNNVGIKAALDDGCEFILVSNNDIVFFENSITELCDYLKCHPNVGIVGPRIIDENRKTQKENMCMKTGMKEKFLLRTRFHVLFPKYNRKYWGLNRDYDKDTFETFAVVGCCLMLSSACAKDITPLDEGTFLYEEEFIIGIRMQQAGWKTVYVPKSTVQHLHGASTKHVKVFAYTCNVQSEIYYCKKYLKAPRWQVAMLYMYRVIIYMIHCLKSEDYRIGWRKFLKDTICKI